MTDPNELFAQTDEEKELEKELLKDRVQIQQISITHDAIANFLVANPGRGQMAKAALHFGVTRPWLSTLVHSDAFQAHLRNKQDEVFKTAIMPLKAKIAGAADVALDRLGERLEVETDTRVLADAADKLLNRLGYGPKPTPTAGNVTGVQNNYFVDSDMLAEARQRIRNKGETIEHEQDTLLAPEGVQGGQAAGGSFLGEESPAIPGDYSEES